MKKITLYIASVVCCILGFLSALRMIELVIFGSATDSPAYKAGLLMGRGLMALLLLLLSWKAFSKARAA